MLKSDDLAVLAVEDFDRRFSVACARAIVDSRSFRKAAVSDRVHPETSVCWRQ